MEESHAITFGLKGKHLFSKYLLSAFVHLPPIMLCFRGYRGEKDMPCAQSSFQCSDRNIHK